MRRLSGVEKIDTWKGWVAGADEAGWGAMAGPLVVAAVLAPTGWDDPLVGDSKVLTEAKREKVYQKYLGASLPLVSRVSLSAEDIDRLGPSEARKKAFRDALDGLHAPEGTLFVLDGNDIGVRPGVLYLPKADAKVPEVGLASIMAKVHRDRTMVEMDPIYPGYGFAKHKGYVTKDHQEKLVKLGPCAMHRRSYAPVSRVAMKTDYGDWMGWED